MFAFFLSSGLFLGWSLGANDASNVFGTAVGSRMIRFRTAAILCSAFLIIGAVVSGAGASHTLGKLGAVNAIAGAFMVAFAAALSVFFMTLAQYPVSTSQAIVGAIIGWNMFSGSVTDSHALIKIMTTWVACPLLSALISVCLYKFVTFLISYFKIHMFRLDMLTRYGLILSGVFGSYSLGANNIANVMGVFVPVSPFETITLPGGFFLTSAQQLFMLGGIAISVGVFTYSRKVMETVGEGIFKLSPVSAFVAVTSHSLVLFMFSSQSLQQFLIGHGLPPIPLVPVSSSQAIVGAVIGMGLLKGGRNIKWKTVGGIAGSWITTPIVAALISFLCLFFLQNVFLMKTYTPREYAVSYKVLNHLNAKGVDTGKLEDLSGKKYDDGVSLKKALVHVGISDSITQEMIFDASRIYTINVTREGIDNIRAPWFEGDLKRSLESLAGQSFTYKWEFKNALDLKADTWGSKAGCLPDPDTVSERIAYICRML